MLLHTIERVVVSPLSAAPIPPNAQRLNSAIANNVYRNTN